VLHGGLCGHRDWFGTSALRTRGSVVWHFWQFRTVATRIDAADQAAFAAGWAVALLDWLTYSPMPPLPAYPQHAVSRLAVHALAFTVLPCTVVCTLSLGCTLSTNANRLLIAGLCRTWLGVCLCSAHHVLRFVLRLLELSGCWSCLHVCGFSGWLCTVWWVCTVHSVTPLVVGSEQPACHIHASSHHIRMDRTGLQLPASSSCFFGQLGKIICWHSASGSTLVR
jgi:hypothetical protein